MPIALTTTPDPPEPLIPPRKRWTRDECKLLETSGIWEQQRLELINGELISKKGQNRPHVVFLNRMFQWLVETLGWGLVYQDAPIDVAPGDNPINEPEPDLIVLKRRYTGIRTTNFQPDEIALAVEVSDSMLRFDRTPKAALYARAGIVEYWVLDVYGRGLIVHREPAPEGYRSRPGCYRIGPMIFRPGRSLQLRGTSQIRLPEKENNPVEQATSPCWPDRASRPPDLFLPAPPHHSPPCAIRQPGHERRRQQPRRLRNGGVEPEALPSLIKSRGSEISILRLGEPETG
jgi:Uma2 family endonuclease